MENSRETFRKQALHHFRNAALVEDNGKATNSPNYKYRLTEETLQMVRAFRTSEWQKSINRFLEYHEKLVSIYASKKKMTMMPVKINGADFKFSAGKHNELQKAIIEEFAPRKDFCHCISGFQNTQKIFRIIGTGDRSLRT